MLKVMMNLTIIGSALAVVCVLGAGQAVAGGPFLDDFEAGTFGSHYSFDDPSRVTLSTLENNTPSGNQSVRIFDDTNAAQPALRYDAGSELINRLDFALLVKPGFDPNAHSDLFRVFDLAGVGELMRFRAEDQGTTYRINAFSSPGFSNQLFAAGSSLSYDEWADWTLDFSNVANFEIGVTINGASDTLFIEKTTNLPDVFKTMSASGAIAEFYIDDFGVNIPEPASLMLLAVGTLLLRRR